MIDPDKPLEAYHPQHGTVPLKIRHTNNDPVSPKSGYYQTDKSPHGRSNEYWRKDWTCCCGSEWVIRNLPDFSQESIREMWKLVQQASDGISVMHRAQAFILNHRQDPVALLANSVDLTPEELEKILEERGLEISYEEDS